MLLELKSRVETVAGTDFNSVLLNYYRDHRDSMGFHSDDEKELGQRPIIDEALACELAHAPAALARRFAGRQFLFEAHPRDDRAHLVARGQVVGSLATPEDAHASLVDRDRTYHPDELRIRSRGSAVCELRSREPRGQAILRRVRRGAGPAVPELCVTGRRGPEVLR